MDRQLEVHYINTGFPYSLTESFMDFLEHLVYTPQFFCSENSPYQEESYWLRPASPQKDDREEHGNTASDSHSHESHEERSRSHDSTSGSQVFWQDSVYPDDMTYEELLDLGEAVGTQSRGLSQDLISKLPIKKYKCSFFSWTKKQCERCVICQMTFKRRERQMTLPCKHIYHVGCISRWLGINKACPICYVEVFFEDQKH